MRDSTQSSAEFGGNLIQQNSQITVTPKQNPVKSLNNTISTV